MSLAEREAVRVPGGRVLCVPEARWLRWIGGLLEVGDERGVLESLPVRAEDLMLVGRAFGRLTGHSGDGRRLAVAARFAEGAAILIERRGGRIAVAASPKPRSGAAV